MNQYNDVIKTYQNLSIKQMLNKDLSHSENAFVLFVKQNFQTGRLHLNDVQVAQAYSLIPN